MVFAGDGHDPAVAFRRAAHADHAEAVVGGVCLGGAGQALDEIELPDGWSWAQGSLTLNEGGECTVTAIYTPEDTGNYQTVAVEITVNVLPAGLPVWAIVLIVLGCTAVVAVVIVLIVRGKKKHA